MRKDSEEPSRRLSVEAEDILSQTQKRLSDIGGTERDIGFIRWMGND